jgi:hypothetical protein
MEKIYCAIWIAAKNSKMALYRGNRDF